MLTGFGSYTKVPIIIHSPMRTHASLLPQIKVKFDGFYVSWVSGVPVPVVFFLPMSLPRWPVLLLAPSSTCNYRRGLGIDPQYT